MPRTFFLFFNHHLTPSQEKNARSTLGIERIENLPGDLQELWRNIPPDLSQIRAYLAPLRKWLSSQARPGDYVLIQGDFGATYLMVNFALDLGLIPVYSTTRRVVSEEVGPDGTIKLTHHFQHQIFRKYGG